MPRTISNLGLDYKATDALQLGLPARAQGDYYLEEQNLTDKFSDFAALNLSAKFRINPCTSVDVQLRNVTGREYVYAWYASFFWDNARPCSPFDRAGHARVVDGELVGDPAHLRWASVSVRKKVGGCQRSAAVLCCRCGRFPSTHRKMHGTTEFGHWPSGQVRYRPKADIRRGGGFRSGFATACWLAVSRLRSSQINYEDAFLSERRKGGKLLGDCTED